MRRPDRSSSALSIVALMLGFAGVIAACSESATKRTDASAESPDVNHQRSDALPYESDAAGDAGEASDGAAPRDASPALDADVFDASWPADAGVVADAEASRDADQQDSSALDAELDAGEVRDAAILPDADLDAAHGVDAVVATFDADVELDGEVLADADAPDAGDADAARVDSGYGTGNVSFCLGTIEIDIAQIYCTHYCGPGVWVNGVPGVPCDLGEQCWLDLCFYECTNQTCRSPRHRCINPGTGGPDICVPDTGLTLPP